MKSYEWPNYKNYSTKKKYIQDEQERILLIPDRGKKAGEYYALEYNLRATAQQYGGFHMGVGKACSEGIESTLKLAKEV